jgi:hypothetical protein
MPPLARLASTSMPPYPPQLVSACATPISTTIPFTPKPASLARKLVWNVRVPMTTSAQSVTLIQLCPQLINAYAIQGTTRIL